MPRPAAIPGVPQGLEYLSQVAQLLIHQQVELLEGRLEFVSESYREVVSDTVDSVLPSYRQSLVSISGCIHL